MTGYDIFIIIVVLGLMFGTSGCSPQEAPIFVAMGIVFVICVAIYAGLIRFLRWFKNTF